MVHTLSPGVWGAEALSAPPALLPLRPVLGGVAILHSIPPGKHVVFASLPLEHFCMLEMPGTLNKQKCVIHSTAIIFSILAGSSIWFSFGLFVCFLSLVLAHRRMLPTFYTFSLVEIISPSIAEHLLSHE